MRTSTGTLLGTQAWEPVKIGGLGFITGMDVASDGSWMVCRTDVGGAYRREFTASEWTQIISSDAMTIPSPSGGPSGGPGVFEIKIAPSNPDQAGMFFRGRFLRSLDRGVTWADDNLNGSTGLAFDANGGNIRLRDNKFIIDRVNPEVMFFGSPNNGGWRRLNGTWANIPSLPLATGTVRAIMFAQNPLSSNTGSGATLRKSEVWATVNGSGLYRSTDGGSNFALMPHPTGTSTAFRHIYFDSTGKLWVVLDDGTNSNLWFTTNAGATWARPTLTFTNKSFWSIYQDPKNPNRFVGVANALYPVISLDGGATWNDRWRIQSNVMVAENCVMMAAVFNDAFTRSVNLPSTAHIYPHPTLNRDEIATGYGTAYFQSPWPASASSTITWYENTTGIEELVSHNAMIVPEGGTFLLAQDRGTILMDPDGGFAEHHHPPSNLTYGCDADYAIDNPDFIVCRNVKGQNDSGYSTDGGLTWTNFTTQPTGTRQGGSIVCSNSNQIVIFPGQNTWPRYTADGGVTWATCNFAGFSVIADGTENGFGFNITTNGRRFIACSDKDNPGVFYCLNYGPTAVPGLKSIWKSTDGGANWAKVGMPAFPAGLSLGFHAHLFWVDGDLYITPGPVSNDFTQDAGVPSFKSINGGVTWTQIAQLNEIQLLSAGAPPPDSSVYTLYARAWKSNVFGLYRSFDKGVTWEALNDNTHFDHAQAIAADPSVFGRVILGYIGTGFAETTYDYTITLKAA